MTRANIMAGLMLALSVMMVSWLTPTAPIDCTGYSVIKTEDRLG
jgi:hypothetical protein